MYNDKSCLILLGKLPQTLNHNMYGEMEHLKNAFKISSPCTQEKSMRKKNVIASLQKYSSTEFKIYRMMQTKNNYFHGKINDPQDKY